MVMSQIGQMIRYAYVCNLPCTRACSVISDFVTPWSVAHQAPLSIGFPRQEYWSGLHFPPPRDLSYPGIKPEWAALAGDSLPLSHQGSLKIKVSKTKDCVRWTQSLLVPLFSFIWVLVLVILCFNHLSILKRLQNYKQESSWNWTEPCIPPHPTQLQNQAVNN